jgi:DNA-directed RNA polymerase specialized sigma24 family protein
MKVRSTLNLELHSHEASPVSRVLADNRRSSYVRASRYRRLLHFVARRVLDNPDRAAIAVENCLFSASRHVPAFECEGAFRSWLVRLALDEALAILHGRIVPEHRHENGAAGVRSALSSSQYEMLLD